MKPVGVTADGTTLKITVDVANYRDRRGLPKMILDVEEAVKDFMHENKPVAERLAVKGKHLVRGPLYFERW